jgi:hypothetical protein
VPRHHAAPGGSILPLQRRHQRHRLSEPAGLAPLPRPRRRARHAFTIRHHQRMTTRLGGQRRNRHTGTVHPDQPRTQATRRGPECLHLDGSGYEM